MKKVVFLPLDERPCNFNFPYDIFNESIFNIVRPNIDIMGFKKRPANYINIKNFLLRESLDAYALVIAIDTLLYGGIIPSRLHFMSANEILERLSIIKEIKKSNPNIKIYAYNLIMRTPTYNSQDEEPDYHKYVGRDIFDYGFIKHKMELEIASKREVEKYNNLNIKDEYLEDFSIRRNINTGITKKIISYVDRKYIDFLVIPQDDSSEYGWTAKDQEIIRDNIKKLRLQNRVFMYPGADEVANILFSRLLIDHQKRKPLIYIKYNSITAPFTTPSLEDRYLDTTIKYQLIAAGAIIATSMKEADAILFVNAPSDQMITSRYQYETKGRGFTVERNMVEYIESIRYCIEVLKKPALVADLAYGNGSDIELVLLLEETKLLMEVASYSGWNTSANALDTAIGQGILYLYKGNTQSHKKFLASRYIEDCGYWAIVRRQVTENHLEQNNYDYHDVEEKRGLISSIVERKLKEFINDYIPSIKNNVTFNDVYMPWERMYEVGLDISYREQKENHNE